MQDSPPNTSVDLLFEEHRVLVEFLMDAGQISLRNNVDNNFRKTLAVAAASYIETNLCDTIIALFTQVGNAAKPMVEFVRNKAINRRYHDLFDWNAPNANKFFSAFGGNFKEFMVASVSSDPSLDSSIRAFLELGQLRNELVHQNFAIFPMEKTVEEIYALYRAALRFTGVFPSNVMDYMASASETKPG